MYGSTTDRQSLGVSRTIRNDEALYFLLAVSRPNRRRSGLDVSLRGRMNERQLDVGRRSRVVGSQPGCTVSAR